MGIDAKIVVRLKNHPEKPTEAWLLRMSWLLCASIGAKHFFIQDGLKSSDFKAVYAKWSADFNAHPKHAAYVNERDDHEARNALYDAIIADVGPIPQERRLAIDLSRDYDEDGNVERVGKVYSQDADPVIAEENEWLLEVSVWSRFYGVGYERGDLLTLCAIAEWCEANIPNSEVWYGGDSSGVELAPFGDDMRRELRRHLYSAMGREYFNYMSFDRERSPRPPGCGLCVPGEAPQWRQYGSGGNYCAVSCAGCGKSKETHDNGKTWTEPKDR